MDLKSGLHEVDSWPLEERLRLVDEIWRGILGPGPQAPPEPSAAQHAELARRLADDDATPDDVVDREEVKAAALRRAGR